MEHRSRTSIACALTAVGVAAMLAGCGGSHAAPTSTRAATATVQSRGFGTCAGRLGTQGSLGGVPVPFPPEVFHVTNMWLAKCHGVYIDVYAGTSHGAPAQGALMVVFTDPKVGTPEARSGTFKIGRRTGPLTLTSVRGKTVHFRFQGGIGTFSLETLRYSSA